MPESAAREIRPTRGPGVDPVYDSALRAHPMIEEVAELFRYRDLLRRWAGRNIALRYKRSVLGLLWTLLQPLMMMVILTVVFSAIFRIQQPNYPVYVLTGLLLLDFFSRSTQAMIDEVEDSQSLVGRIYVPRSSFALAAVGSYFVHWMIASVLLALLMIYVGAPFTPALLTLPFGLVLAVAFTVGWGLLISTVAVFFPDVRHAYQVILTAWFYATPVIYPLSIVPERYRHWFAYNPLYHLLVVLRTPIEQGAVAPVRHWLYSFAVSVAVLLAGWWTFSRYKDSFDYRN